MLYWKQSNGRHLEKRGVVASAGSRGVQGVLAGGPAPLPPGAQRHQLLVACPRVNMMQLFCFFEFISK